MFWAISRSVVIGSCPGTMGAVYSAFLLHADHPSINKLSVIIDVIAITLFLFIFSFFELFYNDLLE
jgi:hypothetical protein